MPGLCAVCRSWGHGRLCAACLGRFGRPVRRCGGCALALPAAGAAAAAAAAPSPAPAHRPAGHGPGSWRCGRCLAAGAPVDHAVAVADYAFPWDALLLQFKFHAALDLAGTLAHRLRLAIAQAAAAVPPPDLVLPVPLTPGRLRERGFNQSWELARRLGRPACPRTLRRVRDGPHQLALPEARRAANVAGAFAVDPARSHRVAGRHVAVVDDVMTTGATARAVAAVLREAGAARVSWWVVARTPRPGG